jgi:hypothetical protein
LTPLHTGEEQLGFEDTFLTSLALVGGLGFWEAWQLPMLCRNCASGSAAVALLQT